MALQTIPLYGSFINRGDITKDQQFFNCFPEVNAAPISNRQTVHLYKRFGISAGVTTTAGNNSLVGNVVWKGKSDGSIPAVLSFKNSAATAVQIYSIGSSGLGTQVGSDISNVNNCYEMAEASVSGTSNLLAVLADSGTALREGWYFPEGGAWTQITDVDFPPNQTPAIALTGCPVQMDGYVFWMCKNGQLWNSDINSVSAYSANNFISAQNSPDLGVGLARYKDYIVAFGERSIEFFVNAGNPTGSPLSAVPNSTIHIGALAAFGTPSATTFPTIKQIGDHVYFIGVDSENGNTGVFRLNGQSAEKISSPTVDKTIGFSATSYISGISGSFSLNGQTHILFNNAATDQSFNLCYCITTGEWWTFTLPSQTVAIMGISSTGLYTTSTYPAFYFNGYSTGSPAPATAKFYGVSSSYQDVGSTLTMTIRTAGIDFGTDNRKIINRIWLDADTQASGTATIEYSDDDYASWVTLGTFDLTQHSKFISGCGSHQGERAYRLTHSANTAFRASALRIDYTVGTS